MNIPFEIVDQITFEQCKHIYLKNKQIIDKFMIQTILYEFSDESQKYTSYLNHMFANIYEESYLLNEDVQDLQLFCEMLEQYLIIMECKDVFLKYIQNERVNEVNQEQIDQVKFYLFKVTYLSSLQNERNEMFCQYLPFSDDFQDLIFDIIQEIEKLRKHYKQILKLSEQKNEKQYERCYDSQELISSQNFNFDKIFQSYKIENKEYILKRLSKVLKEEEEFLKDFLDCLQLKGEDINIMNYKKDKENMFFYTQYIFQKQEQYNNLVDKYKLTFFKFFDNYNLLYFVADSQYIEQLCQDEIVLFFYIFSALYLVKYNILFINLESCLYVLIKKLDKLSDLQQKVGIMFTLKFIKDLKEKESLEEDIYELFLKWDTNEYLVSSKWLNKEQVQLYINTVQSFIKLAVIPDLARFFFMKNQQIPFQISNHKFSFAQQIIRGKQLYLQNPDKFDDQIKFWKNLKLQWIELWVCSNQYIEKEIERESIALKICEININVCEILQLENQNNKINLEKLDKSIQEFVDQIHCSQYQNIYRKRQLFYTLQSLFIKDDIVIPIIIQKIKYQQYFNQNYNDSQSLNLLLLSNKNDFDIQHYIHEEQKLSSISNSNCKEFLILIQRYYYSRGLSISNLEEKMIALREFSNIILDFKILSNVQFNLLNQNIEFYIKKIDLLIELESNQPKKSIIFKEQFCLGMSQFKIDIVQIDFKEFGYRKVARKWINKLKDQKNFMDLQNQIINEISILYQLKQWSHKNIIKFVDYQIQNGKFELFLEYCENGSLKQFLLKSDLNKDQKIQICIDILEGVQFLHNHGILHGDLKLENLVVDSNGVIKIIDFGASTYLVEESQYYTPSYQSYDKKQSLYYDYFSIGMILFSVLLQDVRFSVKYYNFNQGQPKNKKSLKQYIQDQKEKIEQEFSPSILKEILNLFNDQPFLRPKLSKLIQTLNNHLNKQNQLIKNVELKYSFKEALNNLKNQNQDSTFIQLIIEKNFILQPIKEIKKNNTFKQYNEIQLFRNDYENDITLKKNISKQCDEITQLVTQKNKQTNQISKKQRITQNESQNLSRLNTYIGSTESKKITVEQFKDIKSLHYLKKFNLNIMKFNYELQIVYNELQNKLKKKEINQNIIKYQSIKPLLCESCFLIDLVEINNQLFIRKSINQRDYNLDFDDLSEQLLNECSILLQLQRNKNIIQLIDYQIYNEQIELFLEYCENGQLYQFLQKSKLNKDQKINMCVDILEGVQFLHKHGILHGDLKLSNLVVDSNEMVKIIDFGGSSYLNQQQYFSTEGYKSEDKELSLFKDYFSIGIILFSILLQDTYFSRNYLRFKQKKRQNKRLMLDYFKYDYQKQIQLENEFSPSLFCTILEVFNDQSNLRPKLSSLIKIFNDYRTEKIYKKVKEDANNQIQEAAEEYTKLTNIIQQIEIIKETNFNNSQENLIQYFISKTDKQYKFDNTLFKMIRKSKFDIRKFQLDFYGLFFHNDQNSPSFMIQYQNSINDNKEFFNILQDVIGCEQIKIIRELSQIQLLDKDIDNIKENVLNQIYLSLFSIKNIDYI